MSRLRYKNTITLQKVTAEYQLDGSYEEVISPTLIDVLCNVQPLRKTADRINLPEGLQSTTGWNIRVPIDQPEIIASDPVTGAVGDIIVVDGLTYRASYKELWRNTRLAHWKVIAIREDIKGNS